MLRIAVAAAVLLAAFAGGLWYARRGERALTLDEILARGDVAVRGVPSGTWSAREPGAAPIELASASEFLEVRTPSSAAAQIDVAASADADAPHAIWSLSPSSALAFAPATAEHADRLAASLGAGSVVARRAPSGGGEFTVIATREGAVHLVRGEVRIAGEAPEHPETWEPRPNADTGWVHVAVTEGQSLVPRRGGWLALADGAEGRGEAFLSAGEALVPLEPGASEGGERTSVDDTQAHPSEPPVPAEAPVLDGKVVRESDGAPLDEFRVVLLPIVSLPQVGSPIVQEFRGAHGHFTIDGETLARARVRSELYRVEIQSPGLAAFRLERFLPSPGTMQTIEARLDVGGSVRGIVLDDVTGRPIPGAWVVSESDTPVQVLGIDFNENEQPSVIVGTFTRSDGGFELEHLRTGTQLVRASAPGYGPAWSEAIDVARASASNPVELRLRAAARIEGSILDANGAPMVNVFVLAAATDFTRPCLTFDFALSDASGEFDLHDLSAGYWAVLKFGPPTRAQAMLTPEMKFATLTVGSTARVDFHALQALQVLRGTVRDASGRPIAGRTLTVAPIALAAPPPEGKWNTATTDENGRFELQDLEPGPYAACITCRTPAEVVCVGQFEVTAGSAVEHDFVLSLGGIRGTVKNGTTHEPMEYAVVVLMRRTAAGDEFCGKVLTDAHGNYELPFLAAGDYTLTTASLRGDLAQELFEPLTLSEGQRVEALDFELQPGAWLTVVVTDGAGAPIANAQVAFTDSRGRKAQFSERPLTDVDGLYPASGVPAGHWKVAATAAGYEGVEREIDLAVGMRGKLALTLRQAK
jgi:protocatechuate 3,4-dioxygenase beta subunit